MEVPSEFVNVTAKAQQTSQPAKNTCTAAGVQPTLFDAGAKSILTTKTGKTFVASQCTKEPTPKLSKSKEVLKATCAQCRWCDQVFNHHPARTLQHKGPMRGQASLFSSKVVQAQLTEAQKNAEIQKQVTSCLRDIILEVERLQVPVEDITGKKRRKDGQINRRAFTRGAQVRQGRSPQFKAKVVREVLRVREQYPGFETESVSLVADSHNVNRSQVTKWLRSKETIFKKAKSKKDNKQLRDRKCRGKFQKAEADIYKEFTEARKVGKRIGPRWRKQCATRHVRKAYVGTDLEGAAKMFSAQRCWFRRFCKRWNVV